MVVVGAPKSPLPINVRWMMSNDITFRGSLWFERWQVGEMLRLAASGAMPMQVFDPQIFALSEIDEALAAADALSNPMRHVTIDCGVQMPD